MSCKNCKSRSLKKIINIGKQPISSHFYKKKMRNLRNYSLDLYICKNVAIPKCTTLVLSDNLSFDSERYSLKMYSTGTAPALTVIIK